MDEQNSGFILCDISFNGQLVADVKLPKACSMSNIVQGLWLDDNFRKTGLEYLKTKDEKTSPNEAGETSTPVKSFGGIDRCILRAYVAIRIMPAWKWLEFRDFIVDFENKKDCYTVGDILGTLCTGLHKPVLRIVPKSENEADNQEVKNIVMELLKTRSLATLAAAECPLSNGMLSLIAQGKYNSTIGHDKCQAFIEWLRRQDLTGNTQRLKSEQILETPKQDVPVMPSSEASKSLKPRISFSQNEIENLTEWFDKDERPSRDVMRQYTDILNIPRKMASIRLLTPESIYFWFKNRRSKQRKVESSLLEPWEREGEITEGNTTPKVTMAIGDTPQVTTTTATTATIGNTSDAPQVTTTRENSSAVVCMPVNGLATMLAQYTPPHRQLNYGGSSSSTKPRKIPKSRVTFDPQTELNSLNKWFDDNERPGKQIIDEYTTTLNEARSQKSKRMLTPDSIAMWFKNRRAKKKRCEGDLVYTGDSNWEQTTEEFKHEEGQESATSKDVDDATASMDITTTGDVTTVVSVPNAEVPLSAPANSGVVTSQAATEEGHERNVFSAGLVAVKPTTI